jgi:hypothetical protein
MKREDILEKLTDKRVKDYSFLIGFFLVFSIFVLMAIRPNLVTAFSLQRELEDLRIQDAEYERVISNIVQYQSIIEQTRADIPLLEEAIPLSPEIFLMVRDIRKGASESGIIIDKLEVSEVELRAGKKVVVPGAAPPPAANSDAAAEARKYMVKFEIESNFTEVKNFISRTVLQRRLKTIENLIISGTGVSGTQSATFRISFTVDGYYL